MNPRNPRLRFWSQELKDFMVKINLEIDKLKC